MFDYVDFPGLWGMLAVVIPALAGMWTAVLKIRAEREAAKDTRIQQLEERTDLLEARIDQVVEARRSAERREHQARMALSRALDYIERIFSWIEQGGKPPPPDPPNVAELKQVLQRE